MENKLKEYAQLLIEVGLSVKPGQNLVIASPIDCAPFARLCASAAYDVGCREVILNWSDDYMTREKYLRAAEDVFDTIPQWRADFFETYSKEGTPYLSIYATDPENLKGVDPNRLTRAEIASGKAMEGFRERQMKGGFPWCIASVPTQSWAAKVFPKLPKEEAEKSLWKAIFRTVRVGGDGKAVKRWEEHIAALSRRKKILTEYQFKKLHYQNDIGTDLWVELPEDHYWEAGSERTTSGEEFCANMPTEEIFTAPKRTGVNGTVVASMPLVENGNIIEGIRLILKDGKIIEAHADTGEDILRHAISVDEGAAYLGEVALVPCQSPIAEEGILFYNTLFDENASCHFAFGDAYPCIQGGADMTKEERLSRGLNSSITHVDFMVGTKDLSIIGVTAEGEEIPVFINGNFAF